eukprot:9377-Heterococcus_DN1.PRE.2
MPQAIVNYSSACCCEVALRILCASIRVYRAHELNALTHRTTGCHDVVGFINYYAHRVASVHCTY